MRVLLGLVVAVLAIFAGTLSLAAQAFPPPVVKVDRLRQISPHVYIIPDNGVPVVPNIGYVIGDRAELVIDTGLGPPNGAAVYKLANELGGSKTVYLVTTHVHPEHDLGGQAFPDSTKLIRSTDQVKDIEEFGLQLANVFAKRSADYAQLLKDANFRKADITFDREVDIDLGGIQAKMIAMGANHTAGDTVIWIESDRVLFAGDLAMRAQPAFASPHSSLEHWLASLDRLQALDPANIVPSHGPTGNGTGFIIAYRAYLTEVRDRTGTAKRAGQSVDQVIKDSNGSIRRSSTRQSPACWSDSCSLRGSTLVNWSGVSGEPKGVASPSRCSEAYEQLVRTANLVSTAVDTAGSVDTAPCPVCAERSAPKRNLPGERKETYSMASNR